MKKLIVTILCISMFFGMALYVSAEGNIETMDGNIANAMLDNREQTIMALLEQWQLLLHEENVDTSTIDKIRVQLEKLDVQFLTEEEVIEQFPKAIDSLYGEYTTMGMEPPASKVNTWLTYRTKNYLYNGKRYNVQRLIAQPAVEKGTPLWDEDAVTVKFSNDWQAGKTNIIKCVASIGASQLAPITSTVYDVFSSTWSAVQKVSTIDPGDVIYRWENSTNVVFSYVRLESQTDDSQELVLIASKCTTDVAFIADIDEWSQLGNGTTSPKPAQVTGSTQIVSKSEKYDSVIGAIEAYISYLDKSIRSKTCISQITISGPESKVVVKIYPCNPEFPLQCE